MAVIIGVAPRKLARALRQLEVDDFLESLDFFAESDFELFDSDEPDFEPEEPELEEPESEDPDSEDPDSEELEPLELGAGEVDDDFLAESFL